MKKAAINIIGIGAYGSKVINVLGKEGLYGADLTIISNKEQKVSCRKVKVNRIWMDKSCESALYHALIDSLLTFLCFAPQDKTAGAALAKIAKINKSLKTLVCVIRSPSKAQNDTGKGEGNYKKITGLFTSILIGNSSVEIVAHFLKNLVEGVALPNLVGLDLSEVINLLRIKKVATLGIGNSKIESIEKATEQALNVPFLKSDYEKIEGARVYAYFTGGPDMRLENLDKAAAVIIKKLGGHVALEWGARVEEGMKGNVTVMVLLPGLKYSAIQI